MLGVFCVVLLCVCGVCVVVWLWCCGAVVITKMDDII